MLHPDLLQTFVVIAETGSFTRAARQLGVSQSTISQHVGKLEAAVNAALIARTTHRVTLTPDGDAFLSFAREVLAANDRMHNFFGSELRVRIRLGAGEDFMLTRLSAVLARFKTRHPSVDMQLTVGLSAALYQRYDAGELDVIFVKRRRGDERGVVAWREQVAWIGREDFVPDGSSPLPLVLYPPPSITRTLAIEALDRVHRSWRVACTSGSLAGIRAAVKAGLGIAPHSARLLPQGLSVLPAEAALPSLGTIEFVVLGAGVHDPATRALVDLVLESSASVIAD